jgi:Fe-S-cluster-containing dehydrogenase component/DMSO reductase anchor subunit
MASAPSVVRLPLVGRDRPAAGRASSLMDQYLRAQQELTAVDRFARRHSEVELLEPDSKGAADEPSAGRVYRDLLPLSLPAPGQQYAFEVDLDACTGCKACVTACHSLNGLDEDEMWRSVGILHGGTPLAPVAQSVTTACHHCLDPACMKGCPVGAYEKDPVTGIVRHLDDQCIGCQYCTLTCPYEVPRFNARRGIVRKCDMCEGRLASGEAPACVQGCPNEAIAIRIVETQKARRDARAGTFLPGAPSPDLTVPTTAYRSERSLPPNLLAADGYALRPAPRHVPLVWMLVLVQLSAGAFVADALAARVLSPDLLGALRPPHALFAAGAGILGLGASVLHLGRPRYAFRALIGLRTSWMSREILAFGLFAALAVAYAGLLWQGTLLRACGIVAPAAWKAGGAHLLSPLGVATAAAGSAGVGCSVLIYRATRRPFWGAAKTTFRFVGTAVVLGLATSLCTLLATAAFLGSAGDAHVSAGAAGAARGVAHLLAGATAAKLAGEAAFLLHLFDPQPTACKRSALLLTRDLRAHAILRLVAGLVGGILLPLLSLRASAGAGPAAIGACGGAALLIAGELLERMLFFAAATPSRMPGAPA